MAEQRLIDANAFKEYIRNAYEETKNLYTDNGEWAKEITESFCQDIDEQPTIEPEPHFCRDCKWVTYHGSVDKHGTVEALWHCHNWDGGTDEEGFCHEWERRA